MHGQQSQEGGHDSRLGGDRRRRQELSYVGLRVPRLVHVAGIRRLSKLAVGHWNREREDGKERD